MAICEATSKGWLLLLAILSLQVCTIDASISNSFTFPQDVFAKPAFKVRLGHSLEDTPTPPIKLSAALAILEKQKQGSQLDVRDLDSQLPLSESSLIVAGRSASDSYSPGQSLPPVLWTVQRSSPSAVHLCSIPDFSPHSQLRTDASSSSSNSSAPLSRRDLIARAQRLLEPLKQRCLYHTVDWFTYSFCHGKEVRQFRLLTAQAAGLDAHKKAGGGAKGEKAAMEAMEKVAKMKQPAADPTYPAFLLGRWRPENDLIVGDDQSHRSKSPLQPKSTPASTTETAVERAARAGHAAGAASLGVTGDYIGTDLVEEVQFGDWDEEEFLAAEAKVLATLEDPNGTANASAYNTAGASPNSNRHHRYITQTWSDGTLCDVNHQPRKIEVQFHCSNRKAPGAAEDRITLIKETTTCNYVMIIETSKLCAEPAFGGEKEDRIHPIRCHPVVQDSFQGPTLGDAASASHQPIEGARNGVASLDTPHQAGSANSMDESATDNTGRDPKTAHTNDAQKSDPDASSHTYGDLSHYKSTHDDYYDEALGSHGPEYERLRQEQLGDHHHHHSHTDESAAGQDPSEGGYADSKGERDSGMEKETFLMVAVDENGQFVVETLDGEQATTMVDTDVVGRKRTAKTRRKTRAEEEAEVAEEGEEEEDEEPLEIQLELDDLVGVLSGADSKQLEKKLAERISQKLNQMRRQQHGEDEQREEEENDAQYGGSAKERNANAIKDTLPQGLHQVYEQLMKAVDKQQQRQPAANSQRGQASDHDLMDKRRDQVNGVEADGSGSGGARKGPGQFEVRPSSQQGQGQQQPKLPRRMAKVGDSLAERAKRFYDARDKNKPKSSTPAAAAEEGDVGRNVHREEL